MTYNLLTFIYLSEQTAIFYIRCACPVWASGIEDTRLFLRVLGALWAYGARPPRLGPVFFSYNFSLIAFLQK